ncbi:MAG: AAA family ATPase [Deltaproteobacteria bacterium]|nr:AAA family ATPase [Deltaproteobacteria bacterium]
MFNSISVSGYKGLSDLKIFEVPRILLIGGQNNVGKSSLLEAIFMALDRLNPDLLTRHFSFRGVGAVPLTLDSWWRPIFGEYNLTSPIKIRLLDSKNKWLEFIVRYDPSFTNYNIQQAGTLLQSPNKSSATSIPAPVQALHISASYGNRQIQDSNLVMQPQGFSFQMNRAEGAAVAGVYISSVSRSSPRDDSVRYGQLDLENKTGPILDIVRLIDPRISDLSVVAIGEGSEIHANVDGFPRKIPVSLMGDGIGRILSITLSIFVSRSGVVLVDEIENGLHHSKLPEFWTVLTKACIAADCQLVATTHNYECLSAASKSTAEIDLSCFSYVRLDRSNRGKKLAVVQYSGDELSAALAAEFEVR